MIDTNFVHFPRRDGKAPALTLVLLGFVCLVFVAYAPAMWNRPYWDDNYLLVAAKRLMALGLTGFSSTPELSGLYFYRPIELSLVELNLWLVPTTYAPLLFFSLLMHIGKGVITGAIIRRIVPGNNWAPIVGALIYIAHPIAVSTTIQIDIVSANLASLCGAFSVLAVLHFANLRGLWLWFRLIFISLIALVGFFAKESFFVVGISLPALFAIKQYPFTLARTGRYVSVLGLGVATAMALYLFVRSTHGFGLNAHADRYDLALGINVIRNTITLILGTLFYSDTHTFLTHRNWIDGVVAIAIFATPLAVAILTLRHQSVVRLTLQQLNLAEFTIVVIAIFAGLFPEALTKAVSEHNTAMILPFVVAITVSSFTAIYQCMEKIGLRKPPVELLATFIVVVITWGIQSVGTKTAAARDMSDRIAWASNQIKDLIRVSNAAHVCVNEGTRNIWWRYSIYALPPNDYIPLELFLLKYQYPEADISWEDRSPGHLLGCDLWF